MAKILTYLSCLFIVFYSGITSASSIDSLKAVLKNTSDPQKQTSLLLKIAVKEKDAENYNEALTYASKALTLARSIGDKKKEAKALLELASANDYRSTYPEALRYYYKAIDAFNDLKLYESVGVCYNNIGTIYIYQGNHAEALKAFLASLKIKEQQKDTAGMALTYLNIGNVYAAQSDFENALGYTSKSLDIYKKGNDKNNQAICYNNLGMIYNYKSDAEKDTAIASSSIVLALENYQKALDIFIETGFKKGIATGYNNIGVIFQTQGEYAVKQGNKMYAYQVLFPKALMNYELGLKIKQEINDQISFSGSYMNIASIYKDLGKFNESRMFFNKALSLAKEMGSKEDIRDCYYGLALLDSTSGNFKEAFNNYKLHKMYVDSVHNEENTSEMLKSQMNFDFEKKEAFEKAEQEKKEVLHKAELSKQRTQRNALYAGIGLLMLLAIVSYKSFLNKKKSHAELETKNKIIEEKNKDITDSINYAKQIQQAILPTTGAMWTALKDHFILYKPKDIVSGDFYWFAEKQDLHFLAVVDCTGHGVPGAFMSMVGSATLNNIVTDRGIYEPNKILDMMHTAIRVALNQEGGLNRDGMDIGLCVVDKKNRKLSFAGAMRNLYLVQNDVLSIRKGDRRPIGGVSNDSLTPFTKHEINLIDTNTFYLTSDGYADQFGGPDGKKFREKQFNELLEKICMKPMKEQKAILESEFISWKGNLEQIDDVCVVGVRV